MKRFIFIIIILGLALAAAGFWYWQRNPYSKDVLKLEILGPEKVGAAEEVEYTVKFKNNGNVRLEEPRLIFEFPQNTLLEEDKELRQKIEEEELGAIYPGQEKSFKFEGRLFGKEGDIKTARAWLSFKVENLKASYESSTTLNTEIKEVPLSFNLDLPSQVESGRGFAFSLNYFSNIDYPLTNLGIQVEYPSGFEFLSSSPSSLDKKEWDLSLINKAEGGRIEIKGKISGESGSQKIFEASLGVWNNNEFTVLKKVSKGVEIGEPYLSVFQRINGQDEYIASPGEMLHYEIFFRNVSKEPFKDLFLVSNLRGKPFDFDTVRVSNGEFNKEDRSIVWDWRDVSRLSFLDKGEEGKVEFWIETGDSWDLSSSSEKNFTLRNEVLVSEVEKIFETKVNTRLVASQEGYYEDSVFGNSGPLPPEVGKETTYTIVWEVKNHYNDLKDVVMKAELPGNVELTGEISPEEEKDNFTFDVVSREIVWRVNDDKTTKAGSGVLTSAPRIAFQISLKPYSSQEGEIVDLIRRAVVQGEDQWTKQIIRDTDPSIDTSLPDDPSVSENEGEVED